MGKTAFLFSGQGAQCVGMGHDLYENNETARKIYDEGEKLCPGILKICFEGPQETLNRTKYTQPALFLTDLAIAESLRSAGVSCDFAAGFSLGEIPALAFSGKLSFETAFRFVMLRAETMDRLSTEHPGQMAAVLKLQPETVNELCAGLTEVWPVNYNCPGQVSCAGKGEGIDRLVVLAKEAGGRAVKLPVSGAFHTPYMADASVVLREFLENAEIGSFSLPVYANRTASVYPEDREGFTTLLTEQVKSPVLWQKTLENLSAEGVDRFIEVGVGSTLTGFVKRTLKEAAAVTVTDLASMEAAVGEKADEV